MYSSEIKIRVRYAETDRMGYGYYGNYSTWFEVARVEALRELGITYKNIEDEGILLPVLEYQVKFKKPVHYDDELVIKTYIKKLPDARIRFEYEVINGNSELIAQAETTLVFVNRDSGKPTSPPIALLDNLKKHFD